MRRLNFSLVLSLVACSVLCAQNTPNSYSLNQIATPWRGGAFADFNGDGALDYAALCFNNQSFKYQLNIFLGRGDGFASSRPVISPTVCSSNSYTSLAAAGDFNHDQKNDLVFILPTNMISYALGNGDGTFQTMQTLAFPVLPGPPYMGNAYPVAVYTADFNNDGYEDILAIDNAGDAVVYLTDKSGGFAAPVVSSGRSGTLIGDVNHDGYPDLVFATYAGITVALGKGDGSFTQQSGISYTFQPSDNGQLADLNGDGNLDPAGLRLFH
jgi:hypothetical protein